MKRLDSKLLTRSVVTVEGTPNLATHVLIKISATVSAVVSLRGTASVHRLYLSIIVSKYRIPLHEGKGPTISKFTASNLLSGDGIV